MVYSGRPYSHGWFRAPILGNLHIYITYPHARFLCKHKCKERNVPLIKAETWPTSQAPWSNQRQRSACRKSTTSARRFPIEGHLSFAGCLVQSILPQNRGYHDINFVLCQPHWLYKLPTFNLHLLYCSGISLNHVESSCFMGKWEGSLQSLILCDMLLPFPRFVLGSAVHLCILCERRLDE